MACFHPVKMWRLSDGELVMNFSRHKDIVREELRPCGQCIGCRQDYASMWATRMMHESKMHRQNCVITLTYDDAHFPYRGMINYPDVQKFVRKLRKEQRPDLIRFGVGSEYGEQLGRPHHHCLLFGFDFPDKREFKKSKGGTRLWTSEYAQHLWPHGFTLVGELDFESAAYIARYCVKKVNGDAAKSHYRRVDPETGEIYMLPPEQMHCSNHPGLGASFFAKYRTDIFRGDGTSGVVRPGGHQVKVPRYYDRLEKRLHPEAFLRVQVQREVDALDRAADCTPERLAVRELCARAALALKQERQ